MITPARTLGLIVALLVSMTTACPADADAAASRVSRPRTITYVVATKGAVTTDIDAFAAQVAETLADPRGWSRAGITFKRVDRRGQFTVWLAAASSVPTFGKPCTAAYSCRAGRNVAINEDRWRLTTPAWASVGGTRREYRNLVVNHEVGHWLGLGHRTCRGRGTVASVMQQQSKDLGGCRANAWPLDTEVADARIPT